MLVLILGRPSFLQELQSRKEKESLYVVTEAMEATRDATFQSRAEGAGRLSLLQLGHVQVQGVPWGRKRGVPGAESHQGAHPSLLANHPISPRSVESLGLCVNSAF